VPSKTKRESPWIVRDWLLLGRWLLVAALTGVASAYVVWGFFGGLSHVEALTAHLCRGHVWIGPLVGAVLLSVVFFRISSDAYGDGTPAYLVSVNQMNGYLPTKGAVVKWFATILTLGSGGSGGVVGPMNYVCGGVGSFIGRVLVGFGLPRVDVRRAVICGAAGAMAAVLHSPIGAGLFAVEVLKPSSMRYADLFPAIVASATSFMVCQLMPPFGSIIGPTVAGSMPSLWTTPWFVAVGLVCGFVALTHIAFLDWSAKRWRRLPLRLRVLLGGALVSLFAMSLGQEVLGTGAATLGRIIEGPLYETGSAGPWVVVMVVALVGRMLTWSATVGSGMSAGMTGPSMLIGALVGAIMAAAAGASGDNYIAFVAAGMAGMLAASVNVPIAAAVIAVETFGGHTGFAAVVGSVIAYQVSRRKTIYDMTLREQTAHAANW